MALLNIIDGYLSFGADPILNHASFSIEEKERLCIVGRNGSGKSTLMSIITEERDLDSGRIEKASNLKIVKLQQDPPKFPHKTALEFVLEGFSEAFSYIREYNELLNNSEANHDKILELQTKIETLEGWNLNPKAHEILSKLQIDPNIDIFDLSGGMKRKVLLAQVLMQNPDILLLDEPTNHLDIETVKWLEDFLMKFNKSVVFVSHDRAFIENLATRIVDIDRGVITSYPGKYKKYLESKQIDLEIEEATNTEFDKKLAIEEKWIRKGVKARGTRNEGRVKNLKELRREKEDRIKVKGSVEINSNQIENGGMVVYKINNLNLNFENNIILKDFTAKISQGEKIALIGPNGSGKTTFINMLLGEINPTSGTIKEGTGIEIAYFDQLRSQLDDEKTVLENVADGAMFVNINGKPKHVMGELKKFLFDAKRVNSPVKSLSGGEKNRLLLVKILLRPHNVFILDEPTNDLDIDTLMLLENYLKSYTGTIIIVSHDREFINNVANVCYFFNKDKTIDRYLGNYFNEALRRENIEKEEQKKVELKDKKLTTLLKPENKKEKLSYHEKKDLEELPIKVESLEEEINSLQQALVNPELFEKSFDEQSLIIEKLSLELKEKEELLDEYFARWEEVEAKFQRINS